MSYDPIRFAECARQIIDLGREFGTHGWMPATGGSISLRLDATHIAITASGRDKGSLGMEDILAVDLDGKAINSNLLSSAETLLHTHIYRRYPEINAVVHTHSRTQTVASRLFAQAGMIQLQGYEMLKALRDFNTHETMLKVPVVPNSQNMADIIFSVENHLATGVTCYGYLVEGHGIYVWGHDLSEVKRHLEAFEFLLSCELDLKRLKA